MPYKDKSSRAAYDAKRKGSRSQKYDAARRDERERERRNGPFVAIDSEGGDAGPSFTTFQSPPRTWRPHRTFLWGAGDAQGDAVWLFNGEPLGSETILKWLLALPAAFAHEASIEPIFVAFAFGYDATQIFADLPYERAWELSRGVPWGNPDNEKPNARRVVFWRDYGFSYLKGKELTIYGFEPKAPRYLYLKRRGKPARRKLNWKRKIRIFDVYGFFQSSFLKALKDFPGACTPEEFAIIEKGKSERGSFDVSQIDHIREYTAAELRALAKMLTALRGGMLDENIRVATWHGAGSIAAALLKSEATAKRHLCKAEADKRLEAGGTKNEAQLWAHRAYFGGRIELLKQGVSKKELFGYDISSAYPAAAVRLPATQGGTWPELIKSPSPEAVENASALSIVHVRTYDMPDAPFFPLPYRLPSGSILFPRCVNGYYMRDEALAAIEWTQKLGGGVELAAMRAFVPALSELPFAFLQRLFDYRMTIAKGDIREKVIKLGINAVYGKLAQAVGVFGEAPKNASPWHAAAITAWTRAKIMRAALNDPGSIVMFATDGIVSTRPLDIPISKTKTLGTWETEPTPDGGVFVQSGVYALGKPGKWVTKTRGFRPTNLDGTALDVLRETIPPLFRSDAKTLAYQYHNYMTLGASVASRELWERCGFWVKGVRELKLLSPSNKRVIEPNRTLRRRRDRELIDTIPKDHVPIDEAGGIALSAPSVPGWLDYDFDISDRALQDEQEQIEAKFSGLQIEF
jgi:hypothetical protein